MSWIAREGVYNEHLVRDIGGLVNGLAVLAVVAAWTLARPVLVATAVAWLVYSIPHFTFHVSHPLGDSSMQGFNLVVLTSQIVLPLLGLLAISTRREPAADTGHLAVGMHDTVDVSAQPGVETGDDLSLRPGGSHP
jgi:hypothetical protein